MSKNKRLTGKIFSAVLAASMFMTSVPLPAYAETPEEPLTDVEILSEDEQDAQEVSENSVESTEDMDSETLMQEATLEWPEDTFDWFSYDWQNATDEDLTSHISSSADINIKAFLSSLSEEETGVLLERETPLNQPITVYQDVEEDEYSEGDYYDTYYEYIMQLPERLNANWTIGAVKTDIPVAINSGQGHIYITPKSSFDGKKVGKVSSSGMTVSVTGSGITRVDGGTALWTRADKSDPTTPRWEQLRLQLQFAKPAGYTLSVANTYNRYGSGYNKIAVVGTDKDYAVDTKCKDVGNSLRTKGYAKDDSERVVTFEYVQAYAGTNNTAATNERFKVLFNMEPFLANPRTMIAVTNNMTFADTAAIVIKTTPITYYVNYGSGNQARAYGTTYTHPGNPGNQTGTYTVSFSTPSGTTRPNNQTAAWVKPFTSWGGKAAGSTYSNLTTTANQVLSFPAQYGTQTTNQITLPQAPTIAGQTFTGWYYGSSRVGGAGDKYTPSGNVTLNASYNTQKYAITFNGNGGKFTAYSNGIASPNTASISLDYLYGSTLEWSETSGKSGYQNVYNFEKPGYSFDGFDTTGTIKSTGRSTFTAPGGINIEAPADNYQIQEAATLTARWKANTYTITYNPDGGVITPASSAEQSVVYDKTCPTAPIPVKTGYTFKDWAPQQSGMQCSGTYRYAGNSVFDAVYDANKYTVKFDLDGGTGEAPDIAATYDQAFKLPQAPTKPGYDFANWSFNNEDYAADTEISNLTAQNNYTVTLKAEYNPYTFDVKFDSNGGNAVSDRTYEYGDTSALPTTNKAEASFIGWTANGKDFVTAKDVTDALVDKTNPEDRKITLVAKWGPGQGNGGGDTYNEDNTYNINDGVGKEEMENILKILTELKASNELTKEQIASLKSMLAIEYLLTEDQANALIDLIKGNAGLTEQQKLELLQAIASGKMTDEQKQLIMKIISSSKLSDADKKALLAAINGISSLTTEQQRQILSALETGSSAEMTLNGISYMLTKTKDGTLSISIKGINGKADVTIPDFITVAGKTYPITEIAPGSFKGNKDVKTVSMGDNVSKIGASAFEGATGLKSVVLSNNLREIGDKAFKGCSSLGSSLTLPAALQTIGKSAFEGCSKLQTIYIKEPSKLLEIGDKAFFKTGLKSFKLPASVLKIGNQAFANNKTLKTFSFAKGSKLITIGKGTWQSNPTLKKISLPKKITKVPANTFKGDKALTSAKMGSEITEIGASAFAGCTKLAKVSIPKKVNTIGKKAFYGDKKLGNVTFKGKVLNKVGAKAFKKCKKNIIFHCPKNKVSSYKKVLKGKY